MKRYHKTTKLLLLTLVCALILSVVPVYMSNAASKKDVTKTFKDRKQVTSLVKGLNNWIGYQYLYNKEDYTNTTVKLTNNFMLNAVGMNYANASKKGLQNKAKALFGKKPSIKYLNSYKTTDDFYASGDFAGILEDGTIETLVGDWGCSAPTMTVKKIVKTSSKTYTITAQTHMIDNSENTKKLIGTTTFTIKKNKDLKYGYYITGIKMKAQQ
jgi:hypothetical protein